MTKSAAPSSHGKAATATTATRRTSPADLLDGPLRQRAQRLGLYGLLARWAELDQEPWVPKLLDLEEGERRRRSLERRIRNARLGRFKPIGDFDWTWPKDVDRELVDELFQLTFLDEAANVVLVGPNGTGKTTIAQNLAYEAISRGHTARFTTASEMLNDLAGQESASGLARRLRAYCHAALLVIDEVGYLSYDTRHADLLFDVVSRRAQQRSTIVTTNKPFAEWNQVFPNAGCVVALVDRLVHKAEIVRIDGDSYRVKEAKEREARRAEERRKRPRKAPRDDPRS
jgi:DNA replication protein DnaC